EKLKKEAKAQGELAYKLTKERDEAIAVSSALAEDKVALEKDIDGLQVSVGAQYDKGFLFALEQVKILFPDLDEQRIGEVDAMKKIEDGKLINDVPPAE
ncbi:hypothetical protein A2U01_0067443, partial [Trifolium medium]|nr:hypothetical protein [Trifolium medium]